MGSFSNNPHLGVVAGLVLLHHNVLQGRHFAGFVFSFSMLATTMTRMTFVSALREQKLDKIFSRKSQRKTIMKLEILNLSSLDYMTEIRDLNNSVLLIHLQLLIIKQTYNIFQIWQPQK